MYICERRNRMKKALTILECGLLAFSLTACRSAKPNNETSKSKTQIEEIAQSRRYFDGSGLKDTENGRFYLVNESGTTENGKPITFYIKKHETFIPVGYETWDFDETKDSYIYIDGQLQEKKQLKDTQSSLKLTGDFLKVGKHKIEIAQYDEQKENKVIFYKTAPYLVKEK